MFEGNKEDEVVKVEDREEHKVEVQNSQEEGDVEGSAGQECIQEDIVEITVPREGNERKCLVDSMKDNPMLEVVRQLVDKGLNGCSWSQRLLVRRYKKCSLCLYLINIFGPIACIKRDVRWYKYIYTTLRHF